MIHGSRLLVLWVAFLALSGCNYAGPALYLLHGPPRTAAAFEPPDVPTVVFIDDRANLIPRTSLRAELGDMVSSKLMQEKVFTKTISSRDAMNYARANESKKDLMAIESVGAAVGAEQVIYVEMTSFTLADINGNPIPSASCQVRVIDVVNKVRVFPPGDAKAHPTSVTLKPVNPDAYRGSAAIRALEDQIAADLSVAIAKLFYEHETRETGGNLNPR